MVKTVTVSDGQKRPLSINLKTVIGEVGDGGSLNAREKELVDTLKKLDLDGDGCIGLEELVKIGETRMANEKKIKNLSRLILVVVLVSLVFCGAMLGLMVAANEASKDSKPSASGTMETIDGDVVKVSGMEASVTLAGLPYLPAENLAALSKMQVVMPDGSEKVYGITGADKYTKDGEPAVTLYTARGDKIMSSAGTVEVHVGADVIVIETAATRHLLQDQNQNQVSQPISIQQQRQMCVPNCMMGMMTGTLSFPAFGACIAQCSCIGNENC